MIWALQQHKTWTVNSSFKYTWNKAAIHYFQLKTQGGRNMRYFMQFLNKVYTYKRGHVPRSICHMWAILKAISIDRLHMFVPNIADHWMWVWDHYWCLSFLIYIQPWHMQTMSCQHLFCPLKYLMRSDHYKNGKAVQEAMCCKVHEWTCETVSLWGHWKECVNHSADLVVKWWGKSRYYWQYVSIPVPLFYCTINCTHYDTFDMTQVSPKLL